MSATRRVLPELRSPTRRAADTETYAEDAVWASDGEMVRAAYTLHAEDDDFGQARTLLTEVMDDASFRRKRFVDTVSDNLAKLQREEVLRRAFEYWRNVDKTIGDRIEAATLEQRQG